MLIGKRYKVESDENNVILSSKKVAKTGKHAGEEHWTTEGYFANVKEAIKFLADLELKKTELTDLMAISERQNEIYELIKGLKC